MSRPDPFEYDVDAFGCYVWRGKLDSDGYPLAFVGGKPRRAHRALYEATIGPIPDEHALDHLCRNIACVAPHHLEPVTRSENELRKSWRYRAKRSLCPRGHSLATNAIVTTNGGRVCRQCNRDAEGNRK